MTVGSQIKQSLASVKSIQASLASMSTRTQNPKAKQTFQESMKLIEEIENDIERRVSQLEYEEEQYKGF